MLMMIANNSFRYPFLLRKINANPLSKHFTRAQYSNDAEAYLRKFINYESKGIPKNAGVYHASKSNTAFDLERMHNLVKRLGCSFKDYMVVHVAGSKGKGSTVSLLSEILRASGYRVGTYTSPHLFTLQERISSKDGDSISEHEFDSLVFQNQNAIEAAYRDSNGSLTFFEILTGLSFKYYEDVKVDFAVIETGLGGILDATNVIPPPVIAASVITSIGFEHSDALGGTIQSIAKAKAGIMKPLRPVICSYQKEKEVYDILHSHSQSLSSPLLSAFPPFCTWQRETEFKKQKFHCHESFSIKINDENENVGMKSLKLSMIGQHQIENAATAIRTSLCLNRQGWHIAESAIRKGLSEAHNPSGRFQILEKNEVVSLNFPKDSAIVLDAAHTESSALALIQTLNEVYGDSKFIFLIAMAKDKDHHGFASSIIQNCTSSFHILTQVEISGNFQRSMQAQKLSEIWNLNLVTNHTSKSKPIAAVVVWKEDFSEALDLARELFVKESKDENCVLCITGSLYIVSKVLTLVNKN